MQLILEVTKIYHQMKKQKNSGLKLGKLFTSYHEI